MFLEGFLFSYVSSSPETPRKVSGNFSARYAGSLKSTADRPAPRLRRDRLDGFHKSGLSRSQTRITGIHTSDFTRLVSISAIRARLRMSILQRAVIYSCQMDTATNYRYIVKTEGIRGGNARIEGTRIGVHDVIGLLQNGETIDSISNCFPDITRAQVYECLAYYEDHRGEIDLLIARQLTEPAQ